MEKFFYLPVGYPGSGKSTFFAKEEIPQAHIASPDEERIALNPQGVNVTLADGRTVKGIDQSVSAQAWANATKKLYSLMEEGVNKVALDATNLNAKYYEKYISKAHSYGYTVVCVNFSAIVDVEEAVRRNEQRWGTIRYVPPEVIRRMAKGGVVLSKNFDNIIVPD